MGGLKSPQRSDARFAGWEELGHMRDQYAFYFLPR